MNFQVLRLVCRKSTQNVTKRCHNIMLRRYMGFLSNEFACQDAWNEQFSQPLFGKLDMNKYFFEIDRKFGNEGRGSPVDVEIFATAALKDKSQLTEENLRERLDQLEELLRRFRRTPQTCLTMPATHNAVVRAFTNAGSTNALLNILSKPIEFGIFLDNYSAVYLLDYFLTKNNLRDASKVAINMMLQEEYNLPMASLMGIYGTFCYTKNLKDEVEPWDPEPAPVVEEPEDEVKIRVKFLDNKYFDDHFDLTVREHLLGKTMAKMAEHCLEGDTAENKTAKISLQLLGWTMYEKWEEVIALCKGLQSFPLSEECISMALSFAEQASSTSAGKTKAIEKLQSLKVNGDFNLEEHLKELVVANISKYEPEYIQSQTKVIRKYAIDREEELENQYKLFLRESKQKEIEEVRRQLDEKEEHLFFFDNYDKMEKEKFAKFAKWQKTWPRRSWFPQIKMDHLENVDPYRKN